MAKVKTKPGPKPRYGERVNIHVQVPKDDLDYIHSTGISITAWIIQAIKEKRKAQESSHR